MNLRIVLGSFLVPAVLGCAGAGSSLASGSRCATYTVTFKGNGHYYGTRPKGCGIRVLHVTGASDVQDYNLIGRVTLAGAAGPDWTEAEMTDVKNAACELGGDAIFFNATRDWGYEFVVVKAR